MKVLLDTHVVLAIVNDDVGKLPKAVIELLARSDVQCSVSVASLWEIAIKSRLGKLFVSGPVLELDATCEAFAIEILPITAHHVLTGVSPEPPTRDPFDRLLLAQASVEGLPLVTLDRALIGHPVAWQLA